MQLSGQRRLKKATRRICHSVHTPRRCTDTDTHRASLADTGSPDRFHVARERVRLFLLYRRLVTVCAPALRDAGSSLAYLTPWMRSRTRVRSARTGVRTYLHRSPPPPLLIIGRPLRPRTRCTDVARNLPVIDCARAIIRWTTDRRPTSFLDSCFSTVRSLNLWYGWMGEGADVFYDVWFVARYC